MLTVSSEIPHSCKAQLTVLWQMKLIMLPPRYPTVVLRSWQEGQQTSSQTTVPHHTKHQSTTILQSSPLTDILSPTGDHEVPSMCGWGLAANTVCIRLSELGSF